MRDLPTIFAPNSITTNSVTFLFVVSFLNTRLSLTFLLNEFQVKLPIRRCAEEKKRGGKREREREREGEREGERFIKQENQGKFGIAHPN